MKSLSGEVTCLSLCLSLSVAFAHSACIPSGTQEAINRVLEQGGPGARAVLCPGARFDLTGTVKFTADRQEIFTEGEPTGSTRALLKIAGADVATAISGKAFSRIQLHHVIVDGNKPEFGYDRASRNPEEWGRELISMGGEADQVVRWVKALNTRGWSTLLVSGGEECRRILVQHNEIGPAGEPADQVREEWADGISLACYDSVVENNTIIDATDGAIVVFGAAGSRISGNLIKAVDRMGFGGINMVDPYAEEYLGTRVTSNTIVAEGAPIWVALGMGSRIWQCPDPVSWPETPLRGATVANNTLKGAYMGYGFVVDGVTEWTVKDNVSYAIHSGQPTDDTGCPAGQTVAPPRTFQKHSPHASGTFQGSFQDAYVESILGLTRLPCRRGDLNDDGQIDARDVQLLSNMLSNPDQWDLCRGDIDGDGQITEADVHALSQFVLHQ